MHWRLFTKTAVNLLKIEKKNKKKPAIESKSSSIDVQKRKKYIRNCIHTFMCFRNDDGCV